MTASNLQDISKGFKLIFHFVENPYFMNAELWKDEELVMLRCCAIVVDVSVRSTMLKKPHLTRAKSLPKRSRPQLLRAGFCSSSMCAVEAAEIDWIAGKNVTVEKAPAFSFPILCQCSLQ